MTFVSRLADQLSKREKNVLLIHGADLFALESVIYYIGRHADVQHDVDISLDCALISIFTERVSQELRQLCFDLRNDEQTLAILSSLETDKFTTLNQELINMTSSLIGVNYAKKFYVDDVITVKKMLLSENSPVPEMFINRKIHDGKSSLNIAKLFKGQFTPRIIQKLNVWDVKSNNTFR